MLMVMRRVRILPVGQGLLLGKLLGVLNIDSCDATVVSLGYVAATSLLDGLLTSG
jgi:hypothetical protein